MRIIGEYNNNDYNVLMFSDGTKVRYNNKDSFNPTKPESIDLKISNKCNGVNGVVCPQCHERSTPDGKHGDILNLPFIDTMLPYSEVAIGGGDPLTHPDLIQFLKRLKDRDVIANMTVNQWSFMQNRDIIDELVDNELIHGLGVSLNEVDDEFVDAVSQYPNAVIHVINGIVTIEQLKALSGHHLKLLVLGYKNFGRGQAFYLRFCDGVEQLKSEFYDMLPEIVNDRWFDCVSFDNLAIKQLDPKRFMIDDEYGQFYMGNDGQFTMYIDAVNREFAVSSVSTKRHPLMDDIADMFKVVKEDANG